MAFTVAAPVDFRPAPVLVFPLLGRPPTDDEKDRFEPDGGGRRQEEPEPDDSWEHGLLAIGFAIVTLWFMIYRGLRWLWIAWASA